MRRFIALLMFLPLWGCDGQGGLLTAPVTVGMTATQAEAALKAKLRPRSSEDAACWYTARADGADAATLYMMSGDTVVRIDLRAGSAVTDRNGFGIGADEAALTAAYGSALTVAPHKYVEGGHTLRFAGPGDTALVFETAEGKVTTLRAGRIPFVDYVEGCS